MSEFYCIIHPQNFLKWYWNFVKAYKNKLGSLEAKFNFQSQVAINCLFSAYQFLQRHTENVLRLSWDYRSLFSLFFKLPLICHYFYYLQVIEIFSKLNYFLLSFHFTLPIKSRQFLKVGVNTLHERWQTMAELTHKKKTV